MNTTQIVQGILKPDGGLELSEKLNLPPGRVRLTVESIPEAAPARPDLIEVMEEIRREQAARGYQGRTMAEMQADEAVKAAEDEEYEERWRQLWARVERRS